MPVGIFDSGVGGLSVVKEFMRILPEEDLVYFGDTARVPYGTKSKSAIVRFSINNILFLLKHNVKLIIAACNTVSSVALDTLQGSFKVPVLGVINSGVQQALRLTKNEKIGVIGTKATIKSNAYTQHIKRFSADTQVYSAECALFVPLVEQGWLNNAVTKQIVNIYLTPLKKKGIDTLILGCTHYPLLKTVIKQELGNRVALVDSAKQVALQAKRVLKENNLLNKGKAKATLSCYVSDESEAFKSIARQFLGFDIGRVVKCDV